MGREEFYKFLKVHGEKGWKIHIYIPRIGVGGFEEDKKKGRKKEGEEEEKER